MSAWKNQRFQSPFKSLNFLQNATQMLNESFHLDEYSNLSTILRIFQVLTTRLLDFTSKKLQNNVKLGMDDFQAKNESQFYAARTLSLVFIQTTILERFMEYIKSGEFDDNEIKVLNQLALIYGLWNLEKYSGYLFQFEVLASGNQVTKIHQSLLKSCKDLTSNAVALADVLAPPDFVLNSILGNSDGQVYKHLKQSFYTTGNSFGRPSYWSDVVHSKL